MPLAGVSFDTQMAVGDSAFKAVFGGMTIDVGGSS